MFHFDFLTISMGIEMEYWAKMGKARWLKNLNIAIRSGEAFIQSCSIKKVFLKISQNSQENTCIIVFFLIK